MARTVTISAKLPPAVAEMLKDVKAKYKMTTDQVIAELIEESYGAIKK